MSAITLRQLEAFVAVVEEGSVTAAARRLRLSPGAVSVAVRDLERAVEAQLIVRRRGQGVTPTQTGRIAYERSCMMLAQVHALRELNRTVRGELVGPLRLGCFATLSPWLLPSIGQFFADNHPAVDLRFHEAFTAPLLNRLRSGELDAALMYSTHLPSSGFAAQPIAEVRLQVVLAPDHPLAAQEEVSLAALEGEPAILLGAEPSLSHVEEIVRAVADPPRIRWRMTNPETIRSMVARGLGYTIITGRPHGDRSIDGLPLAYRRISDAVPKTMVVLAYNDTLQPDECMRTLLDFCRDQFSRADDPLSG